MLAVAYSAAPLLTPVGVGQAWARQAFGVLATLAPLPLPLQRCSQVLQVPLAQPGAYLQRRHRSTCSLPCSRIVALHSPCRDDTVAGPFKIVQRVAPALPLASSVAVALLASPITAPRRTSDAAVAIYAAPVVVGHQNCA